MRILFLDMDGTVRWGKKQLGRYISTPDDVVVFKEVPSILTLYRKAGWEIVGLSNQGGIALGYISFDDVLRNMNRTRVLLCDDMEIYVCPHHPDAPDPRMRYCLCRKPKIGMICTAVSDLMCGAAGDLMWDQPESLVVGDRDEDRLMAASAGIPFMWAEQWRMSR